MPTKVGIHVGPQHAPPPSPWWPLPPPRMAPHPSQRVAVITHPGTTHCTSAKGATRSARDDLVRPPRLWIHRQGCCPCPRFHRAPCGEGKCSGRENGPPPTSSRPHATIAQHLDDEEAGKRCGGGGSEQLGFLPESLMRGDKGVGNVTIFMDLLV
jgi:hypothetical protein